MRPLNIDPQWLRRKYVDERLTIREVAELAKCSVSSIKRYMNKNSIPKRGRGSINRIFSLPMSDDLAYVLGAIASDGCSYHSKKGDYIIELRVKDKPFAQEFVRHLGALGLSAVIKLRKIKSQYKSREDEYYRVVKGCKEIYEYCKRISLYDFSILATSSQKRNFLKGYYDGDGGLTFSKKDGYNGCYKVCITTKDGRRAELIADLLKTLGIRSRIFRQVVCTNFLRLRSTLAEIYYVDIDRRIDVIKFAKEIGSSIPRKRPNLTLLDKNNYAYGFSDEELLEWLKEISMGLGRSPSEADINRQPVGPRVLTYQRRFGSWNNAKKLAGLETFEWRGKH